MAKRVEALLAEFDAAKKEVNRLAWCGPRKWKELDMAKDRLACSRDRLVMATGRMYK